MRKIKNDLAQFKIISTIRKESKPEPNATKKFKIIYQKITIVFR